MINLEKTPEGRANATLAHLFVGMMKADGDITLNEEIKTDDLLQKWRDFIPGDADQIMELITEMVADVDYLEWQPNDHLQRAVHYFEEFVDSGHALDTHLGTILKLMRDLGQHGGFGQAELDYLEAIKTEFTTRFVSS